MPLSMDIHYTIEGLIVDAIMHAHEADRTPHNSVEGIVPMWKLSRSGILFEEEIRYWATGCWLSSSLRSERKNDFV